VTHANTTRLYARLILSRIRRSIALTRPLRVALILGVLVFWSLLINCLAPFYVRGPAADAPEAAFKARLDQAAPRILKQYGVPGMAIGTVIHGDPGQVYVYGLADVARGRPITPRTVFRVASLSKSVTAWGVLTLVDAGKVKLDQPVERYLGGWPLAPSKFPSREVTVRGLLTHTSGLDAGDDEFRKPGEPAATPPQLLRREGPVIDGRPTEAALTGPAGKTFVYSVPGYTLLQMMIEHQSGRPFGAYMKEAVLKPLGMTSSGFDWDPALRERTATPYLANRRADEVWIPQDAAADGMFSTVGDMVQFVAAPMPGQGLPTGAGVISDTAASQLFLRPSSFQKSRAEALGPDAPCLGCFIEHGDGGPAFITNAGADPGWTSEIHIVPATGDGIVVLTNSSRGSPAIAQVEAIWTDWRGLPAPQVTRSFRSLGLFAVTVVALASLLTIAAGFGCLNEIVVGTRRFGAFHGQAVMKSLLEWTLAAALAWPFFLMREVIGILPRFAMISESILICLVLAVVARALFPERKAGALAAA